MTEPVPSGEAAIAAVQALMDKRARVRLTDGRVLLGRLTCFDWLGNLLLRDTCVETAGSAGDGSEVSAGTAHDTRPHIGMAVVPKKYLVSCEVFLEEEPAATPPP